MNFYKLSQVESLSIYTKFIRHSPTAIHMKPDYYGHFTLNKPSHLKAILLRSYKLHSWHRHYYIYYIPL